MSPSEIILPLHAAILAGTLTAEFHLFIVFTLEMQHGFSRVLEFVRRGFWCSV
jgi:hypothetical protein